MNAMKQTQELPNLITCTNAHNLRESQCKLYIPRTHNPWHINTHTQHPYQLYPPISVSTCSNPSHTFKTNTHFK